MRARRCWALDRTRPSHPRLQCLHRGAQRRRGLIHLRSPESLVDENSPAAPGFGLPTGLTGGAIADTFIYELTYPVIPAPGASTLGLGAVLVLTRRG